MKNVTFEDFEKLEYGDQIILEKEPMSKLTGKEMRFPYVFITRMDSGRRSYMFKSDMGATMSIDNDETIKAFGVKLLEKTDPEYNEKMAEDAKALGTFFDALGKEFFGEQGFYE